ncbi:MAG TPA: conjugal transfer protein TraI [Pedobacter sp.]|jgi:hypothetical protein
MKKLLVMIGMVMMGFLAPQKTQAQIPIVEIIKAGVKKVIRAADLQIQKQQNKVIWLQNAQKTLENSMSKLKLKEISNWTEKQRSLYQQYYDELHKVKATISHYQRIRDITKMQVRILDEYKRSRSLIRQDKHFSSSELDHISKVYSGILDESVKNLDQLFIVINSFQTQMSDAERLELINAAGGRMETNYQDLKTFNRENMILSLQRAQERGDVDAIKKMYGLK